MSNQYVDFYSQMETAIRQRSCPVMNACRDAALQQFEADGFPSQKAERYRYTNVEHDFAPDYGIQLSPGSPEQTEFCCPISLSATDLTPYYNTIADPRDSIVSLNTMLATDGIFIHIPAGVRAPHPIQVGNVLKGSQDTMVCRRILVIMEEGAEADIIVTDHASTQQHFLSNQVMEVFCGKGSRLNLYDIEETNLMCTRYSNVFIHQDADSHVRHTAITLLNGHTRNTCHISLAGEGSTLEMSGCIISDKMQRVDNNVLIEHLVPRCTSDVLYKYVLDDSAFGAFAGKVLVRKGAQQTTSAMTNANLLATRQARMMTQPMLEIYADDVKCSHGSTVGQMNDQALFYMQQRGIPRNEAELLLKSAFITEVIEAIPLPALRDRLHYTVDARIRGQLSKCEGCKLC